MVLNYSYVRMHLFITLFIIELTDSCALLLRDTLLNERLEFSLPKGAMQHFQYFSFVDKY